MIHVDNGCDVDNDSGKLDTSQDFPGNRPWDGQGSDSEYEFPSEGIIIVELPPNDPQPDVPSTVTLQHGVGNLHWFFRKSSK